MKIRSKVVWLTSALLFGVFSVLPAQAQWSISVRAQGQKQNNANSNGNNPVTPWTQNNAQSGSYNTYMSVAGYGATPPYSPQATEGKFSTKGKVWLDCNWNGPDPAPPHLMLCIRASAGLTANPMGSYAATESKFNFDSGGGTIKIKVKTQNGYSNYTVDNSTPDNPNPTITEPFNHFKVYYKYLSTGGSRQVTLPLTLGVDGSVTPPDGVRMFIIAAQPGISAQEGGVYIKSDIEASMQKGIDPDGKPRPEPCVRLEDGSMTVHAAVHEGTTPPTQGLWGFLNKFTAEVKGISSPSYSWSINGLGIISSNTDMQFAWAQAEIGAEPDEKPGTSKLTVEVSDSTNSGSGKISNTYEVVWHLPYENWQPYANEIKTFEEPSDFTVTAPGYAIRNGSVHCKWNYGNPYWGPTKEALAAADKLLIRHPYWSKLFKAAGIAMDKWGPQPHEGSAGFNACWGSSLSTFSEDPPRYTDGPNAGKPKTDEAIQLNYHMRPMLKLGYTTKFLSGENYGPNGYIGQYERVVAVKNNQDEWAGHFEKKMEDDFPPTP